MKIVSTSLKRVAGPALVAGLVVASTAAPAVAAATPGSTAFRIFGGLVGLQARAGVANNVTVTVSGGRLILTDATGIAIGSGCTRVSANSADCGPSSTVSRIAIALEDMNDTANVSADINSIVDAGTGTDTVTTAGGNDLIDVEDNAPGDQVNCGGGADTVFADPGDFANANCERRL
ncbi:hypothetical protein [Streptomyces spinosirectus]